VGLLSQSHKDLPKKAANGQGVSLEEEIEAPLFGAPTFMSAWVYLLAAKEFIREGTRRGTKGRLKRCFGAPTFMSAWV